MSMSFSMSFHFLQEKEGLTIRLWKNQILTSPPIYWLLNASRHRFDEDHSDMDFWTWTFAIQYTVDNIFWHSLCDLDFDTLNRFEYTWFRLIWTSSRAMKVRTVKSNCPEIFNVLRIIWTFPLTVHDLPFEHYQFVEKSTVSSYK